MKKILYGVCGIGNGHTYRQLPTLTHLAKKHKIMIFAYGDSLRFYTSYFNEVPNVQVVEVAVPYYVGSKTGIDFAASAKKAAATGINYVAVNSKALGMAHKYLGKPDLVVSDYEPVSAQFAYAYNSPLVTLDQQSKYLAETFPAELNGQTYIDEVVRLRMFFPAAAARIACSFFAVPQHLHDDKILIFPPVLRAELASIKKSAQRAAGEILVYVTAQAGFEQNTKQLLKVMSGQANAHFSVFLPHSEVIKNYTVPTNVSMYQHGDNRFQELLKTCSGIISTAGHTLLSEAMYLGVPVLAMPLALYEQQMNAHVMHANKFGLSSPTLTPKLLALFINNLDTFAYNIKNDKVVLLRGNGAGKIINFLEENYLK